MTFALRPLVVMGHFETGTAEAALDVETFVGLAAIKDGLVAADVGGDVVEGLNEAEAELLALLVLGDSNVFNVADLAKGVDAIFALVNYTPPIIMCRYRFVDVQLSLDNQGTRGDDGILCAGGVLDDHDVVGAGLGLHVVVLALEVGLGNVTHRRQHAQAVEEAAGVVGASQGAHAVARREGGGDLSGDELIGEQTGVGHGGGLRVYLDRGRSHCDCV